MNDDKKAMKAYLGDPKLKDRFIKEIAKHEKADEIAQGAYETMDGEKTVFCAVGCSLKSMNRILGKDGSVSLHARYEPELGIPQVLARLEDRIFEGLPEAEMKTWPRRFAEAIDVGANLSKVWPKFAIWLLVDPEDGVIRFAGGWKDVAEAVRKAASIYQAMEGGNPMGRDHILAIRSECRTAAADAADSAVSAAYAAAAVSAFSAAYAAADAADSAAYAAAYAAADAAADVAYARKAFYVRMSEKLVELLKEAE